MNIAAGAQIVDNGAIRHFVFLLMGVARRRQGS